jgi:hypothetical protein
LRNIPFWERCQKNNYWFYRLLWELVN